jgi:hypothetical protein
MNILSAIINKTSNNYIVHVYDLFAHSRREVAGSPFALAAEESSGNFNINAGADGRGTVAYACEGGPSLSEIEIGDGDVIEIR